MVADGTTAGEEQDTMQRDLAGMVRVPLRKGCYLVLTTTEYLRGIRRGKWERRRQAIRERERDG